ncbi:MAG: SurA N-terminal domain-containing protein [Candidatus Omnitrophica bacterium]|nr:SurA N-terminal domain-containing protein [Candidatus Omnitrophota bacterium]MBU4488660.1 SurA N-terminal domain-containing protein [Candidatus Omnitrophota bacterium]MCG2705234.1 SurA N-terminal domain-containing protein [Candidatus Omnitrophota bacterium]
MKLRICLLILAIFFISGCAVKKGEERVLARINDYEMSVEDFNYESSEVLRMGRMTGEIPITKKEMLDALITKEVLIQEAVKKGLDKEKAFMKTIELYWEQALLKNLLVNKSDEITQKTVVYEDDIKRYYDSMQNKIKARVIVFSDERSARKALGQNEAALLAWKNEPQKHSIDAVIPSSWYILGEDKTSVEYAVFDIDAKKGKGVTKLSGKWALVIIDEITPNETGPLAPLKDEIIKNIRTVKEGEAMEGWIDSLRSKSRIKIDEKVFDTLN